MKKVILTLAGLALAAGLAWEFFEPELRSFLSLDLGGADPVAAPVPAPDAKPDSSGREASDLDKVATNSTWNVSRDGEHDEKLRELLAMRYPMPQLPPFEQSFPTLDSLPSASFPDRIQVFQPVSLTRRVAGKVLAASAVRAEGLVRPIALEDGQLRVASLAQEEVEGMIAIDRTNFRDEAALLYVSVLSNARERTQRMIDADFEELTSTPFVLRRVIRQGTPWDPGDTPVANLIRSAIEQKYPGGRFKMAGYHEFGNQTFGKTTLYPGRHRVAIVALEGTDRGFGPFLWRAKCLLKGEEILGWFDLPSEG